MADEQEPPPEKETAELSVTSRFLQVLSSTPDRAKALAVDGLNYLQSTVGSLRLFSSTTAVEEKDIDRDETHYFCIPIAGRDFVLAERRRLPPGVGSVNSLPKVRIFHLHDPAAQDVLAERLRDQLSAPHINKTGWTDDVAKRLDTIGEEIDRQSNWVTGGLIVVGGVVAIANPLLGIGIAAKALLPSIGSKLSKFGFGMVADAVRSTGASWRSSQARAEAEKEIKRMKPEVVIDPVLQFLDQQLALGDEKQTNSAELQTFPDWLRNKEQRFTMTILADVPLQDAHLDAWRQTVRERIQSFTASQNNYDSR